MATKMHKQLDCFLFFYSFYISSHSSFQRNVTLCFHGDLPFPLEITMNEQLGIIQLTYFNEYPMVSAAYSVA